MTNAKAIAILDLVVETAKGICDWSSFIPNKTISEAHEMAVKALQAQEWIPCSERLPDSKEYVLVTDYGETNIGRRFCDRWWLDYCGDKMKDVTAWMPMPEPYKAESEEV